MGVDLLIRPALGIDEATLARVEKWSQQALSQYQNGRVADGMFAFFARRDDIISWPVHWIVVGKIMETSRPNDTRCSCVII